MWNIVKNNSNNDENAWLIYTIICESAEKQNQAQSSLKFGVWFLNNYQMNE